MQNQQLSREGLSARVQKYWRSTVRFLKHQQLLLPKRMISISGLFVTAAILTLIVAGQQDFSANVKIRNGIIEADVLAPRDFTIEDVEASEGRRDKAISQVFPVFEYDPRLRNQLVSSLSAELEKMHEEYQNGVHERFGRSELSAAQTATPAFNLFVQQFIPHLRDQSNLIKDDAGLMLLIKAGFNEQLREQLVDAVGNAMNGYIYAADDIEASSARRLTFRNIDTGEQGELRGRELMSITIAQRVLADQINEIRTLNASQRDSLTSMLKPLISANLHYSAALTNAARAVARQQLTPVTIDFRQNQIIARHGDPVTPLNLRVLNAVTTMQQADSLRRRAAQLLGLYIIMLALIFALRKFAQRTTLRQRLGSARAFSLICFTLIVQTILIRVGMELSGHVAITLNAIGSPIRSEFLIPYAGAALIMAFLLDAVAAQICALIVCLIVGLVSRGDIGLMIYAMLSGTAATYGVERYRHRNSITRAGTIIGVINSLAIITVLLISNQSASSSVYLYNILYGIGGGLLTAAFVSLVIPINESLFDILTDVKLLELSNMDLPLLRDLAIRAPGTQQHSMMVGSLAEAAAEAIDANALLVRIGCYYHDIGKMMAPDMFIENQGGKPNPHDTMDPKRSASVITGHVKKGILMAQEAGLPAQIIDIIPQHHGTRRLHYFYNKALENVSKTGEPVNEDHYRYPGPKPQTREAAIVMLSDCAEAAARTLDDPNVENLRTIIKRIMDDVIADGQLEECELTMREFNQVRECLIQTLSNIYHHRIKYPGFNLDEEEADESIAPINTVAEAEPATSQQMAAAAGSGRSAEDDGRARNSGKFPAK